MPESSPPLVTVAFPLYRSRRFLDVIADNIQSIDYPNLEILIGDRHRGELSGADDTVEQLQARFPGDPRIRYLTARDELSWVEHYNALLAAASGEYFCWTPHDDSFPPGYIPTLLARLEAKSDAVLAFGQMEMVSLDGFCSTPWETPPLTPGEPWTVRSVLRLVYCWNIGLAIRGLFRRAPVVEAGLWVRSTPGNTLADCFWTAGLGLLGSFEYVPETSCRKRFYQGSTHSRWPPLRYLDRTRIYAGYARDFARTPLDRTQAIALLWLGYAIILAASRVNKLARKELITYRRLRGWFLRLYA